jgi:hypothetical protein
MKAVANFAIVTKENTVFMELIENLLGFFRVLAYFWTYLYTA